MSKPLYPPAGPQTIGQVLDAGFRIFEVSLIRCLLYGAVSMMAAQVPNIYSLARGLPLHTFDASDPVWLVLSLVGGALSLYMAAAVLLRQRDIASGRRLTTSEELAHALRRLPALLAVCVLALVVVVGIPGVIAGLFLAAGLSQSNVVALGVALVIGGLPVLWLGPRLVVAVPITLFAGKGPIDSIRRSFGLVSGSWLRTALVLLVWVVLLLVFYSVALVIMGMVLTLAGANDVASVTATTPVVLVALRAIGLPFLCAILIAIHGDLQVRREGVDLQQRVAGVAQA